MRTTNMKASVEFITPEKAGELLAMGGRNREIKRTNLKRLTMNVVKGAWRDNGQSISISTDGKLLNGQHRLTVIKTTKVGQWMVVVRGCDKDSYPTLDCGINRTNGDVFHSAGISDSKNAAAAVRYYISIKRGNRFIRGGGKRDDLGGNPIAGMPRQELLDEYNSAPELYAEALRFAGKCYARLRLFPKSQIAAVYVYLIKHCLYQREIVEQFFIDVYDTDCVSNRAAAALRNEIFRGNTNTKEKISGQHKQALLIKAWNAYAQGRAPRSLGYDATRDNDLEFAINWNQ